MWCVRTQGCRLTQELVTQKTTILITKTKGGPGSKQNIKGNKTRSTHIPGLGNRVTDSEWVWTSSKNKLGWGGMVGGCWEHVIAASLISKWWVGGRWGAGLTEGVTWKLTQRKKTGMQPDLLNKTQGTKRQNRPNQHNKTQLQKIKTTTKNSESWHDC